ncbi:MAG: type II toxin-antitoxin system RelE/ParE family toxin [Planctomycetota bacterium]|jgi:plasmid stabilization system protein ParE
MPEYRLAPDAEEDLIEIATYTIATWGLEKANAYEQALVHCFEATCRGEARSKKPLAHRPELQVTRCRHHFVFSMHGKNTPVLIVAILHEKMDLMTRLRKRFEDG